MVDPDHQALVLHELETVRLQAMEIFDLAAALNAIRVKAEVLGLIAITHHLVPHPTAAANTNTQQNEKPVASDGNTTIH